MAYLVIDLLALYGPNPSQNYKIMTACPKLIRCLTSDI